MHRVAIAAGLVVLVAACGSKKDERAQRTAPPACFDTHGRTSLGAKALFERRGLQGGGPTWRSILEVAVRQHAAIIGPGTEAAAQTGDGEFRDAYQVRYGELTTWFSLDDEADGVRFCAGDPALVRDLSADLDRLNGDPAALERAIEQANGIE